MPIGFYAISRRDIKNYWNKKMAENPHMNFLAYREADIDRLAESLPIILQDIVEEEIRAKMVWRKEAG